LINNLKRKYGSSIEDIIEFKKRAEKELEYITSSQDRINELEIELQKQTEMLYTKSLELSKLRKVTAEGLEKSIVYELKFLGMEKAIFKIDFNTSKINGQISYSENGFDVIRFLISMNPGEAVKPLSKVASGGETSRIMLAIKTAFADTDNIPSLIFDEIDTGISGKAAQAVAEKLGQISSSHQVICVTHLPQIASMADTHFYISKSVFEDRTKTSVEKLSQKDRISEIARMLGGAKITELTLKHSEEMINMAKAIKKR
jgi:DNA repair protein RecN (Recombination protein N)